jgi:hypothetical protein
MNGIIIFDHFIDIITERPYGAKRHASLLEDGREEFFKDAGYCAETAELGGFHPLFGSVRATIRAASPKPGQKPQPMDNAPRAPLSVAM